MDGQRAPASEQEYAINWNEDWLNWISSIVISCQKLHKHFPVLFDMYAFLDVTFVKCTDEDFVLHYIEEFLDTSE